MSQIMDGTSIEKTLRRISHEIIEKNVRLENVLFIGIAKKGVPLAQQIAENIETYEHVKIPVYSLDISNYRDDEKWKETQNDPIPVNGKTCILVDDVLFTGRSVRAAMDALMDFGRPDKIQLAVLIDRGHRELPIRPDYVGKNIPTAQDETIVVLFGSSEAGVTIEKKENGK